MVDLIKRFESMDNVARLSIWIVGWLLLTPIMFVWWIIWLMFKDQARAELKAEAKNRKEVNKQLAEEKELTSEERIRKEIGDKLLREKIEKEMREKMEQNKL